MSEIYGTASVVSSAEPMLMSIDPAAEPHIIIQADRTVVVPEELREIAVERDHNIETVTFDCPRYWDNHDLSEMLIFIHYRCADGTVGKYQCTSVSATEDTMHFDWTLSQNATCVKGLISFLVAAKKPNEAGNLQNYWHSRLNREMEVLEGLECDTEELIELYPDIIEQILLRLDDIEKNDGGTGGSAGNGTFIVPHIGENGNWYVGETDLGVSAQGPQGEKGETGETGPQGSDANVTADNIKAALSYTPASDDSVNQLYKAIGDETTNRQNAVTEERNRAVARENEIEALFTLPTQEAVDKWLDEHPEATTTVQDESLSVDKFVIGTLGYVTPEMFGAVGDGVTDDTTAFQDAIDSGFPVINIPNKQYAISGIKFRSNLTIRGAGTLLASGSMLNEESVNTYCFYADGVENLLVDGISIDVIKRIVQLGEIKGSENVRIQNVKINGNAWNADLTSNDNALVNGINVYASKDVSITNLEINGVLSSCGIMCEDCKTTIVEKCSISHTGRGGIYMLNGNDDCEIVNNTVTYSMLNFTTSDGAIDLYATNKNITIAGNRIECYGSSNQNGCGIRVKSGENIHVCNNKVIIDNQHSFCGIFVQPRDENTTNVNIARNNIVVKSGGKTNYYIRLDALTHEISGVIISENVLSAVDESFTATEALSLRTAVSNIIIHKNIFFADNNFGGDTENKYIFFTQTDGLSENVQLINNVLYGGFIMLNKLSRFVVSENIIYAPTTNSRPIMIKNSTNGYIVRNVGETIRTDIDDIVYDDGTNTQIVKENMIISQQ